MIEPIAPENVLLGLIFVILGPLNTLPKINPPISEATHPNKRDKIIIFNCTTFKKKKNIMQNKKTYIMKIILLINE